MLIVISNNINDLVGVDAEVLTDSDGNFLAEFFNGELVGSMPRGNLDNTVEVFDDKIAA